MIRLTNQTFRSQFLPTFEKLMQSPGLNQRVAYNISRLAAKIRPAASVAQKEFLALVDVHGLKDDKGELVPLPGQPGTFQVVPEKQAAWKEAVEKFEAKEVLIDRHPFMVADFAEAKLTPEDYLTLDPLIKDITVVEEPMGLVAPIRSEPKKGA